MTAPSIKEAFVQYRRTQIAEMTPWVEGFDMRYVSVSATDASRGSPKTGDMIARNPKNHADQWLVAALYFADNFEPLTTLQPSGERREAVARDTWASIEQYLRDECGLDCYGFSEGDRANCINVIVNADFLASGLVQDEAAIRANEREKLLGVVTDKLKDETSERYAKGWNNALIAVCAAIRSARNGGAS